MGCAAEVIAESTWRARARGARELVVGSYRDPDAFALIVKRAHEIGPILTSEHIAYLMAPVAERELRENVYTIMLDVHCMLAGLDRVAIGQRDRVSVDLPDALRTANATGSRYMILWHNHPSGWGEPSDADAELTDAMAGACNCVGLRLIDHVVQGFDEYFSFLDGFSSAVKAA